MLYIVLTVLHCVVLNVCQLSFVVLCDECFVSCVLCCVVLYCELFCVVLCVVFGWLLCCVVLNCCLCCVLLSFALYRHCFVTALLPARGRGN